jgi:hypothetical protein
MMSLRDMGCDLAQGFFISEAVPFEELGPLVAEVNEKVPAILRTGRLPENTPAGVLVGNRTNPDRVGVTAPGGRPTVPRLSDRTLTAVANRALGHGDRTIDLTERGSSTPATDTAGPAPHQDSGGTRQPSTSNGAGGPQPPV